MDQAILRLFAFRPVRSAFDDVVRTTMVPELLGMPGVIDVYSGRQGPDDIGPRVIASVWRTWGAMMGVLGEGLGTFHPEYMDETTDRELTLVRVRAGRRYLVGERPQILRVVAGRVRPGQLSAYTAEVQAGSDLDAERDNGPVSLYMGEILGGDPDAFVTVSTWRGWADVEEATGGDISRPRATRRAERLADWRVDHYEIVHGA